MRITILYKDNDLMVINKPSGLVVNKAESVKEDTVQDWVEKKFIIPYVPQSKHSSKFVENKDTDFYKRSGTVHRIDKETSGALILARNESAFIALQRQFKERSVQKTYQALVHGIVRPVEGIVQAPVGRLPWNRKRFGVYPGGKQAETRYQIEKYYIKKRLSSQASQGRSLGVQEFSLVSFFPKTGRTHQIRAHAKYIGHPIVADKFYAGKRGYKSDRAWCPRLFLHAHLIEFTQPASGKKMMVTAPLSDDLQKVLTLLVPVDKNE